MPLFEMWRTKPTLTVVATADHVELTDTHLVLGLKIAWSNQTNADIEVKDLRVGLFLNRRDKYPLRFYPLERFERDLENLSIRVGTATYSPGHPGALPELIEEAHSRLLPKAAMLAH